MLCKSKYNNPGCLVMYWGCTLCICQFRLNRKRKHQCVKQWSATCKTGMTRVFNYISMSIHLSLFVCTGARTHRPPALPFGARRTKAVLLLSSTEDADSFASFMVWEALTVTSCRSHKNELWRQFSHLPLSRFLHCGVAGGILIPLFCAFWRDA